MTASSGIGRILISQAALKPQRKDALFFGRSNLTQASEKMALLFVWTSQIMLALWMTAQTDASIVWTDVIPDASNPAGYNDDANVLNEGEWRVLEPQ